MTGAASLPGSAVSPPPDQGCGPIRVLVAEDMRILRETLTAVLNLEEGIEVVAEVATGEAIVSTAADTMADVAVIDIDLPGTDGLTAAAQLREQCPGCKVLILTVLGSPGNLRRALAAQVAGFLVKDTPAAGLADAVRKVAAGVRVIDPQLALAALEIPDSPLSPREGEVLRRHASGAGPAEIAQAMDLSYGTVRNYLASAVTKLSARNRIDAIRIAAEAGWLLPHAPLSRSCRLCGPQMTRTARRPPTRRRSRGHDQPNKSAEMYRDRCECFRTLPPWPQADEAQRRGDAAIEAGGRRLGHHGPARRDRRDDSSWQFG
jgi:two-component system, NarL family, response regulator DesR